MPLIDGTDMNPITGLAQRVCVLLLVDSGWREIYFSKNLQVGFVVESSGKGGGREGGYLHHLNWTTTTMAIDGIGNRISWIITFPSHEM